MIFNSFNFIVLFPFIFLLYYAIPAAHGRVRNLFLLAVSYLLYVQWKPAYALVLLGVTAVTWLAALLLEKTRHPKRMLAAGVVLALLPLFLFKFLGFAGEAIGQALALAGLQFHLTGLNWAIPVGISFFTLQALGYLRDVYYGQQEAESDFLTYALFVSFFPCILAGPINRASLVIPQLKRLRPCLDYARAVEGLRMLLWGMFMKVVVADRVALYVDTVFGSYVNYTGMTCLVASLLYSVQIYADFAGYSLMAIGVGRVFGIELAENFRRPYFAVSVTDFWHRWHISLSTWLRDCIYIPLGGNRCAKLRCYWNILVTFLVSGIWHGASWTFIAWGLLHGISQVIEKMLGQQKCSYGWLGRTVKTAVTFLLVTFAWIFFRMPTLGDACNVVARILDTSLPKTVYSPGGTATLYMLLAVGIMVVKDTVEEALGETRLPFHSGRRVVRWASYLAVLVLILLCGVFSSDQFIYANF